MRYTPPRRHRGAILFVREDPLLAGLTPELQEENCRRSCEMRGIPVRKVVHVNCSSDEALAKLQALLFQLPPDADMMLAARFYCYTSDIQRFAHLCLQFQCRGVWVYSLEYPHPLHEHFMVLRPSDYRDADRLCEELDREHALAAEKEKQDNQPI